MKVTTQSTSKWLKAADVLAVMLCGYVAIKAVSGDMPSAIGLLLSGIVLNLVVRVLKWWHHA